MKLLAVFAALALVESLAVLPAVASTRDEVLAAEQAINVAVAQHDTAATAKLIVPDYTLVLGGGKVYDRAAFLALVGDPRVTYSANRAHDQSVRFYGDSTAIVVGILDIEGKNGSQAFTYHLRYTDTWVKIDGSWVQAAGHSSTLVS